VLICLVVGLQGVTSDSPADSDTTPDATDTARHTLDNLGPKVVESLQNSGFTGDDQLNNPPASISKRMHDCKDKYRKSHEKYVKHWEKWHDAVVVHKETFKSLTDSQKELHDGQVKTLADADMWSFMLDHVNKKSEALLEIKELAKEVSAAHDICDDHTKAFKKEESEAKDTKDDSNVKCIRANAAIAAGEVAKNLIKDEAATERDRQKLADARVLASEVCPVFEAAKLSLDKAKDNVTACVEECARLKTLTREIKSKVEKLTDDLTNDLERTRRQQSATQKDQSLCIPMKSAVTSNDRQAKNKEAQRDEELAETNTAYEKYTEDKSSCKELLVTLMGNSPEEKADIRRKAGGSNSPEESPTKEGEWDGKGAGDKDSYDIEK